MTTSEQLGRMSSAGFAATGRRLPERLSPDVRWDVDPWADELLAAVEDPPRGLHCDGFTILVGWAR